MLRRLRLPGFLTSCVALGGWFACWTPAAADVAQVIQDTPWTVAETAGLESPAAFIDAGLVDLWPHAIYPTGEVLLACGTIHGEWGEANALGIVCEYGDQIGFVPILDLDQWVATTPLMADANVLAAGHDGEPVMAGNEWTNDPIQRFKHFPHPHEFQGTFGDGCLGLICALPGGGWGGWSPCDDPVMQTAARVFHDCQHAVLMNLAGVNDLWQLALTIIGCLNAGGLAPACWLLALAYFGGNLIESIAQAVADMQACWLAYAQTWANQYAIACDHAPAGGLAPVNTPIPGHGDPGYPQ